MSTQEQISSRNWWVTYVRRVLAHSVRKSKDFALLNLSILLRPTWVGANVILDDGPAGLLRAGKYYLKAFGLALTIALFASRFHLAEGKSYWRDLVMIIAQFVIAMPIIYASCLILERIPFYRLVQAALYVDGVLLIVIALAAIPLYYVDFTFGIAAGNRALDVFATEYENCLVNNSYLYWLLRGDIKYYLYSDIWKPQDWTNWFFENYSYLLAIPFFFIFARMLRPARKISVVLICVVTAIAFIVVVEGGSFAVRQLSFLLAVRDTKCTFGFIDQITTKYAPNLIARQVTYKINNSSLKDSYTYFSNFELRDRNLVMPFKINHGVDHWRIVAQVPPAVRQVYCSDNEPYWVALRRINYNLLLVMSEHDGTLVHQQQFTPRDCPRWPGSR